MEKPSLERIAKRHANVSRVIEKARKLWLKYNIGYSDPQKYWDTRWEANLSAEKATGKSALEEFWLIKSLMEKYSCENILEIGCGRATLRNLPNYLGLDFSLEALKRSGLDKFIYADITKGIPLPDKSQDAILSRYVLLHVPFTQIEKTVMEMGRVAKKAIILKEPYGGNSKHCQAHCFLHNLPELFQKCFQGDLKFLDSIPVDLHNRHSQIH